MKQSKRSKSILKNKRQTEEEFVASIARVSKEFIRIYSTFIINRLPRKSLKDKMSPFEAKYGYKPNYDLIKPFGCMCYCQITTEKQSKLRERSIPTMFLNFFEETTTARYFNLESSQVVRYSHLHFIEEFPYTDKIAISTKEEILEQV